ncbi:Diphthine--ammonia ligase [Spathaspora sp. JA1]|nr:Diphthine--ammonia ligase [Spathaspora sp. JA1]
MKFVALISGGKDSFFNIYHCLSQGHELVALGNLHPGKPDQHEIDSFMFQTVGHDIIENYSQCLDVPLYRQAIVGGSTNQNLEYCPTINDEIEDLYLLLSRIKQQHPEIEGVSCGAILSHYQRTRVENVCERLQLTSLTYLWQRGQDELMQEMCNAQIDARIIKVAAIGLNQHHLGKSITELYPTLYKLNQLYDVNICGEGGEFETIVLDCPFFKSKKLQIIEQETVGNSNDDVFYLKMKVKLVNKEDENFHNLDSPPILEEEFQDVLALLPDPKVLDIGNLSLASNAIENVPSLTIVSTPTKLYVSNIVSSKKQLDTQTSDIFSQVKTILSDHGLTINDIQSITLLLSDMSKFGEINKIYGESFSGIYLPPSRICIQTDIKNDIQLSFTALKKIIPKTGIHIRSRSYWGPQNIGPYSQSILDNQEHYKLASLSGQIPLIPSSMELSTNDIKYNSVLSLQHLFRVKNLVNVKHLASIICFVTDISSVPVVSTCWNEFIDTIEQTPTSKKSLVTVHVNALPRGAGVEWGGHSYENVIGMYDDSDDEEDPAESEYNSLFSQFEDHNILTIGKNDVLLVTLFTSNEKLVEKVIDINKGKNFIQVFSDKLEKSNCDFISVKNVFNNEGTRFSFAIIWKIET